MPDFTDSTNDGATQDANGNSFVEQGWAAATDIQRQPNFNSTHPDKAIALQRSNAYHTDGDTDASKLAQHHTIGMQPNQSASGAHSHNNVDSYNIPAISIAELSAPGTAWTPVWSATTTAPVIGNGILTGTFWQLGKLGYVTLHWEPGTTTTFGVGGYSFTLPFTATGTDSVLSGYLQNGNLRWPIVAWVTSAGAFKIIPASGKTEGIASGIDNAGWKSAWAVGDLIKLSGMVPLA